MSTFEVYELGISDGWDARNYQDAYGGTCEPDEERTAGMDEVTASYYRAGFELGCERFENDEWQDGTPVDQEPAHRLVMSTFGSQVYCETCGHGGCEIDEEEA